MFIQYRPLTEKMPKTFAPHYMGKEKQETIGELNFIFNKKNHMQLYRIKLNLSR